MEVHNRIAMFINNNFEFTEICSDRRSYKQIYEIYHQSCLCDYFMIYGYKLTYNNFYKIIRNLFKDLPMLKQRYISNFKQKPASSVDYGLDGNIYFKQVIDDLIMPCKYKGNCVKLKDLYDKVLTDKFFGDNNIYLTSLKSFDWFQYQLFKYCEFFDDFKRQTTCNNIRVSNVLIGYKFR